MLTVILLFEAHFSIKNCTSVYMKTLFLDLHLTSLISGLQLKPDDSRHFDRVGLYYHSI